MKNKLHFYFQQTYCKWEKKCYIIAKSLRILTIFERKPEISQQ